MTLISRGMCCFKDFVHWALSVREHMVKVHFDIVENKVQEKDFVHWALSVREDVVKVHFDIVENKVQEKFHEPEIAMLRPSAFQLDEDDGKYCRYQKCIKPSHSEREDMSCKCYSAFSTLDLDQIKIWFQNHWSHDRRRRVSTDPQVVNQFLAASKLLGQENKENSMHQEADERGSNLMHSLGLVLNQPDLQPSFSQRLSRVLNDADICFSSTALPLREGILRVMASMLLENASPMLLVQFLKEHYSFGNGRSEDEILVVIRLKAQTLRRSRALPPQDVSIWDVHSLPCQIGGILPWKLICSLVEKDPPDELLRLRASLFGFRILPSEDNNWSSSQKLFLHGVLLLLLLDPHHFIQGEDESGMQFCGTLVFIFRVPISFAVLYSGLYA